MLKLAIIGSREYHNIGRIYEFLDNLTKMISTSFEVVTGDARGVDKMAFDSCNKLGIKCESISPINHQDKINYLFRNIEILTKADLVLAFWDGKSRGTKFVIDYCNTRKKKIKVVMDK